MASPLASVFTTSHNKGGFAVEAITSVLKQDFADFEYWIIENSTDSGATRQSVAPLLDDPRIIYEEVELSPEERAECYVPAMLLNRYYPRANGRYIFFLSDDDLFESRCLSRCVEFLEEDPSREICYFSAQIQTALAPGCVGAPNFWIDATCTRGLHGEIVTVDCQIDGGQIAHRKSCLDKLTQPWFPETAHAGVARHSDGLFMTKLAEHFTFWPIPDRLLTHRCTPLSVWTQA